MKDEHLVAIGEHLLDAEAHLRKLLAEAEEENSALRYELKELKQMLRELQVEVKDEH